MAGYIRDLNETTFPHPFLIFGALNVNAANFKQELLKAKQKIQQGVQAFLTQPIHSDVYKRQVKQLTSSTKYKFKVRSYLNVDGKTYYSSDSKELNVTTKALAVAAPKNVTSSNVTQDALTLSWDKAADVEGYQVYQYNEKTNKYDLAKTVKTTSCTIQNLNPNKQLSLIHI